MMNLKHILLCLTLVFLSQQDIKAQDDALKLIEQASLQAKKENKAIFVKFEASWCSWCKTMTSRMKSEATADLFNDNYIIVPIVVHESAKNKHLENPGALDLITQYKGEKSGLPFWVILDADANVIEDSFNSKGDNLGCPASPDEVSEFVEILKRTSKLNAEQLKVLADTFVIKKK